MNGRIQKISRILREKSDILHLTACSLHRKNNFILGSIICTNYTCNSS